MAKYVDLIGTSTSTATTETAITGSPYAPKTSGRLKKLIIVLGNTAATSLIEGGYIKLQSPSFGGVDHFFPFKGAGLHTAPANDKGVYEQPCDLKVQTGVNVACLIKHDVTPVTPIVSLFGEFEG